MVRFNKFSLVSLFGGMAMLLSSAAWGEGTLAAALLEDAKTVRDTAPPQCSPANYLSPNTPALCNQCKQSVQNWQQKITSETKKSVKKDNSLFGSAAAASSVAAATTTGAAANTQSTQSAQGAAASDTMALRAGNAKELGETFKQCADDVQEKCKSGLATQDQEPSQAVYEACERGAKKAEKFAADQEKKGGGMGDMSKLAGMAAQAMQAMQKKGAASDLSAVEAVAAPEIMTSDLGSGQSVSPTGANFDMSTGAAADAAGSSGSAGSSGGSGGSRVPGTDSFGAAPSSSEISTAMPNLGAGSGSGSDSSGSSKLGDVPGAVAGAKAEANKDGDFEMSLGGGGRKSMVGIRPNKGDLEDLADANTDSESRSEELEGDRSPASEDGVVNSDTAMDGADTIFIQVRQRYSLLRGSGRI